MEVYLDLFVLLNFLVDFLLLLGTNRLTGHPPGLKRAAGASILGGLYAGVCILPGFSFLGNTLWRLASLALMSMIAFGMQKNSIRRGTVFVFLSMALGGVAVGLGRGGFWSVLLSAGGVCMLCLVGFRGKLTQQRYVPVTITCGARTVALTALVDTGNTLRDPISGFPVVVVDETVAGKLCQLTRNQIAHPVETLGSVKLPGLRLIPYSAVGQSTGMLLGIRADRVQVEGKTGKYIVAFAAQNLGHGQYQALTGGVL